MCSREFGGASDVVMKLDDVSVSYGSTMAVEGVSLGVVKGDFFCIVGENGSGKSSLVRCAMGLIAPSHGSVTWRLARELVSYVPQTCSIDSDMPATVIEVVLTGRQRASCRLPLYSREDRAAALSALGSLGVDSLASSRMGELSGGQTRRVLLARALCRSPEVLVLDEPCAGLDEAAAARMNSMLADMNSLGGLTVIMVSHDLDQVKDKASRVAVLNRSLVFCGPVSAWSKRG